MSFQRVDGCLQAEEVALDLIADRFGTPCYVYSKARLIANWRAYDLAFGPRRHRIHYAVKANSSLALLHILQGVGAGFDIVSGGELTRVLAAGARGAEIVFSGVGKSVSELEAALANEVACINVESAGELERLIAIAAARGRRAPIAFRVNPDVDPKTHPYISTGMERNKFGVPMADALAMYQAAARSPHLEIRGIACHIGSQLTDLAPIADAVGRVVDLATHLTAVGIELAHLDLGGGLGIRYRDETVPSYADYVRTLCDVPSRYEIHIEPGRSLVGDAGVLLTTVEYVKQTPSRRFAICDAAMNDLIRPALYDAWHAVEAINPPGPDAVEGVYDIVGPVCETGDFLAHERPLTLAAGTRLALLNAGAYGFAMASTYNTRPRPPEILVDGSRCFEIRRRETVSDLMIGETFAEI